MRIPVTWPQMDDWLRDALAEDLGSGDVTTAAVVPAGAAAKMEWTAKSELVVCGLFAAERVFTLLGPMEMIERTDEGTMARPGEVVMRLSGPARALLTGERVALNLAQHLGGVATLTAAYVRAVAHTRARIAATRKTMPLMRRLEKYAVTVGGGIPHRFGLDDGVLIKDNHVAVAGSVAEAVRRARQGAPHLLKIQVEVADQREALEALEAGADLLLLDNMDPEEIKRVLAAVKGRVSLEASGNMTMERAAGVASAGVDIISVGALTHSAPAADISARIVG